MDHIAQKYAELLASKKGNSAAAASAYSRIRTQDEDPSLGSDGTPRRSYGVESTKTVILYMLNLVCMVLMSILVVGVLIISLIIYLEGSLSVDKMIFVHLTIPMCVLVLNLYVIMLEDHEEERFFKSSKKTGSTGKGVIFVNLALVSSVISLTLAAYFKFVLGGGNQSQDM